MLTNKPIRIHRPRGAAWLVALTVLATGLVVLPATPAAAAGLLVTITPTSGAPGTALWPGQSTTVTGSVSVPFGVNSETVSIIDQTAAQTVASCTGHLPGGSTFSCPVVVSQTGPTTHLYYATAQETSFGKTSSGVSDSVALTWGESVYLQTAPLWVAPNTVAVGTTVTLTATSFLDVGPTPYYIEIFDSNGTRIAVCPTGRTCSTTVTQNAATTHDYRAYVGPNTLTPPIFGTYWRSADSYVTWNDGTNTVSINFIESNLFGLTASAPAIPQGYVIEIFDENSGQLLASCAVSPCIHEGGGDGSVFDGYVAFIAPPATTTLPPIGLLASSNTAQSGIPFEPFVS
jgi:hypothetical protein